MNVRIAQSATQATEAAAAWLIDALLSPQTTNVMVAGGNTPLGLYAQVANRDLPLRHLNIFTLDEYLGVPHDNPRNCTNLLRRSVVDAWGIPPRQFYPLTSCEHEAPASIRQHEETIRALGGLDLVILGLGQNGHIGFNEPGSDADSMGRVVSLSSISVAANREWFHGEYAPTHGVTTGMRTILSARAVLLLAFGAHKAVAVAGLFAGRQNSLCPASYLQSHLNAIVFLDDQAALRLQHPNSDHSASKVRTG